MIREDSKLAGRGVGAIEDPSCPASIFQPRHPGTTPARNLTRPPAAPPGTRMTARGNENEAPGNRAPGRRVTKAGPPSKAELEEHQRRFQAYKREREEKRRYSGPVQ